MTHNAAVIGNNENHNGVGTTDGSLDKVTQLAVAKKPKSPSRVDSLSVGAKRVARSGSLVERVEHVDGVSKTVIETTGSSDDGEEGGSSSSGERGGRKKQNENSPLLDGWRS